MSVYHPDVENILVLSRALAACLGGLYKRGQIDLLTNYAIQRYLSNNAHSQYVSHFL